ncbi:protein sel-1 homolog 3 isoform X2 [Ahaetulla prasina]|uniref:protein sel-1 homolog 3 isoform X2 n=1 Tax=Ahaetulla prasina TaxID=499056 RepID=UPI00264A01E3|nr:protein sel-1 homolog 3 isoform X2 [Ahaetulla prasina]
MQRKTLSEDFIHLNVWNKKLRNSVAISVAYFCSKPCIVTLEAKASLEFRKTVSVYKKRWEGDRVRKNRTVSLTFPNSMVFRDDYLIKRSLNVDCVILYAWITHKAAVVHHFPEAESYWRAIVRDYCFLDPVPPFERPYKDHKMCLTWSAEQTWKLQANRIPRCPHENDLTEILNFPYASSGEGTGIVKKFQKFENRELEAIRKDHTSYPTFTISAWLYLLRYCERSLCGVLYFIDSREMYGTPAVFLTNTGYLHIQMRLVKGGDLAVKTTSPLPLQLWFRLDLSLNGQEIDITIVGKNMNIFQRQLFNFQQDFYYDDTDGYLVLGGSGYVSGIKGYFGSVKYYRLNNLETKRFSHPFPNRDISERIEMYYQKRANIQSGVTNHGFSLTYFDENQLCPLDNYYLELSNKYRSSLKCVALDWEKGLRGEDHSMLEDMKDTILRFPEVAQPKKELAFKIGRRLFEAAAQNLSRTDGLLHINASILALKDSSHCGCSRASYVLGVIFEIGLGVSPDPLQGLLYSLVAAQEGDRLALMSLGYKHYRGINNYPQDLEVSYAYYSDVALKTPRDQQSGKGDQALVEAIRLQDDELLKALAKENGDVFMWLKHEAVRGDSAAQQRLGQMLFWGQQGVEKNLRKAVEWYAKGALENEDPVSLFDYSIVLFKGQGVKRNKRLAFQLMRKASSKGFPQAVNGLGWYYHNFKRDYAKAAKYWLKAEAMGSPEASFNLGVLHLDGLYPGATGRNRTAAAGYFYKAAEKGHMEGTLHCSQFYITGNLPNFPRDPEKAVLNEALLYYILSAETGIEVSQTNLAHLCEEKPNLTKRYFAADCVWKYYNFSISQSNAPSFAYLKVGDFYYYGYQNQSRNLDMAARMYAQAALREDAQGFFNLALLLEEGYSIPSYILHRLEIDSTAHSRNMSLRQELYERCWNHSNQDSVNPCTLALLYLRLRILSDNIFHSNPIYYLGCLSPYLLVAFIIWRFWSLAVVTHPDNSAVAEGGPLPRDEEPDQRRSAEHGASPGPNGFEEESINSQHPCSRS